VSETNDPRAVELPLANSEEFCQAVLDDIEHLFRRQYGIKWSPEAQQVFQNLRRVCIASAQAVDGAGTHRAIRPLREAVMLTNYTDKSR